MSTRRLTILLDRDDLADVEAREPRALSQAPLVFDVDLHAHLRDLGVAHVTPWDIIEHREYQAIRAFEDKVWQFWTAHAHAPYQGLDLLQILPYRHMMCFGRLVWVAYVVRRALESIAPGEVVTFEETAGHGLDQPAGYDKMPLLFGLVRGMAESAGIPTLLLRRRDGAGGSGFVDWTARLGELGDVRHRRTENIGESDDETGGPSCRSFAGGESAGGPVAVDEWLARGHYVLMPASGPDLVRQLPLIRRLRQETDLAVVQLYKSADEQTLERVREVGHYLWHESQVAGPVEPASNLEFACRGRKAFDDARRGLPAPLSSIFDNHYVDSHFDFLFGEYLDKLAWQVNAWHPFLCKYPPRIVVVNTPNPVFEIASHLGLPCLALSHGLMLMGNTAWFKAFPACTIGAISEKHRNRLIDTGIPAHRVTVCGDPHIDELIDAAKRRPGEQSHSDEADLRRRESAEPGRRLILLLTGALGAPAKTDGLPKYDWADAVRCLEQIGELAARRPQWRFAIRLHPRYDHPALYGRINRTLPPSQRFQLLEDGPLSAVVPFADAVVACNVVTSALIETSLYGKPVMQLRQSMCWYDHRRWGLDRWRHLDSVSELERELEWIFEDPSAWQSLIARTRAALADFCGGEPEPSVPRCMKLLGSMIGGRAAMRATRDKGASSRSTTAAMECRSEPGGLGSADNV